MKISENLIKPSIIYPRAMPCKKKLLNYSIEQDEKLFETLKKTQPLLLKNSLEVKKESNGLNPILFLACRDQEQPNRTNNIITL